MSDFHSVLDAAEQHLLTLKARGVRFVSVEASTLTRLREPAPPMVEPQPIEANPTSRSEAPAVEIPVQPQAVPNQNIGPDKQPAVQVENREAAMEELRGRACACLKCPHLVKNRKNVVFGVGDIHAQLMFVGEAPGADEDAAGEPFVGAAGQLLTRIINTMGLSRQKVYIANILKCRPDTPGQSSGNRPPTREEMKTCLPYLLAQIDLIKPRVLVALGGVAMQGLLGPGETITRMRGTFRLFRDIPLMPTFHPSYVLRSESLAEKRKVWEDMLQVMGKLQLPISEKQRGYFLKG